MKENPFREGEASCCGFASPVGYLRLTAKGDVLCRCEFTEELCTDAPSAVLLEAVRWLAEYFDGKAPQWCPATAPEGSSFAQEVWSLVSEIPFGQTRTYGEVRDLLIERHPDKKYSARAIGAAVGRNPLAIFCPCHRVIGSGGKLTGYAWGLPVKAALIEFEKMASSFLKGN